MKQFLLLRWWFILIDIQTFVRTLRRKIENKRVGFDTRDIWELDVRLAEWLVPRLIYLRNNSHGYPDELTEEGWIDALDSMIYSFELVLDSPYDYQETQRIKQEGLLLFAFYYDYLWD